MNHKELRIGNLLTVKYTKQIKEDFITEIKGYDIVRIEENDFNTLNYEPIPLTEEWLLKFGFKHIKDNWYNLFANQNTFNVYVFDEMGFRVKIVSQSICVLQYVHQLQNLYFALTNEELTFKQ